MRESERRMLTSAVILERMVNLNTFHDIAQDFRYYDDPSDELKITETSVEGSVLPLWTFSFEETNNLEVTGVCWNVLYADLLGEWVCQCVCECVCECFCECVCAGKCL